LLAAVFLIIKFKIMASIASYKDYANLRVKNKEHYLKVVEKLKSKGYTQKGGILDGFSNFPEGLCINVKNKHFFLVAQFRNKLIRTIDNVESIDCKHHPLTVPTMILEMSFVIIAVRLFLLMAANVSGMVSSPAHKL
jgi:hypothetical protein